MIRSGWVKYAVMALLSAALVVLSPVASPANAVDPVTLSGHITGPDGAPVDGARLRVRAPGTQAILFAATSDATGAYSVQLPPGTYDLTYLGAPESGLLATAPGKSIPVDSTYDAQVLPGTITITGSVSSISGATRSKVILTDTNGQTVFDAFVNRGATFSATVVPGTYRTQVSEFDESQGQWFFNGTKAQQLYEEDTKVDVVLPIHSVTLRVEDVDGNLVPATAKPGCFEVHPPGWVASSAYGTIPVAGETPLLLSDTGPGDADCQLSVTFPSGTIRTVHVPGNVSVFTVVEGGGTHITGTVSDGLGHVAGAGVTVRSYDAQGLFSGSTATDGSGHYDLAVEPGSHSLTIESASSPAFDNWSLTTGPVDATADVVVDLAPVVDTLVVHPETPGGAPAPSTGWLECGGTPVGQTFLTRQDTLGAPVSGTTMSLPGTAGGPGGQCRLHLDPDVGVSSNEIVTLPDGGGDLTVVVDPGITVTGQVSVPGVNAFTGSSVTARSFANDVATTAVAPDGSFTLTGVKPGQNLVTAQGHESAFGDYQVQRTKTLADGDVLALTPEVDWVDLYLLGSTGSPGSASATLRCSGGRSDDIYAFEVLEATRSGVGQVRLPGYAGETGVSCLLVVTWADGLVVSKMISPDPDHDTSLTMIRYGAVLLAGDPTASNDSDDVPDALEAYAPNVGDGDADGTPDYQQPDVASLPELGGGLGSSEDYVTVEGPDASVLDNVATDDVTAGRSARAPGVVAGPPDGTVLPRGFLDFEVKKNVADLGDIKVVIHLKSTAGIDSYSTYDPVTHVWTTLPSDRVKINPTSIELTLTDGGIGDVDGAVNGRIRHPGGGTKLDVEVPVVAGRATTDPNDKGWYDGNVTVKWSVTDDKDTIAPPAETVTTSEGDDVVASSAQVCDRRGNCSSGAVHLKIDKTKPVVSLAGPVNGATYVLGAVPSRRCTGTDPGGSGVPDGGACHVTITGAAAVGTVTVTAKATDRAGNTAAKSISYKVAYKDNALSAPAAGSKPKIFKQGSTVVVRLKLLDAKGSAVSPAKAPAWLAPKAKGTSTGKVNQKVNTAKPDKGSVLIKRGSFWEYRWGTAKAKAGKAYVIKVRLDDGTTRTVTIGIG